MIAATWGGGAVVRTDTPAASPAGAAPSIPTPALPQPAAVTGDPFAALIEVESLGRSASLRNAVRELGAHRTARKDAWAKARASLARATRRRRKKGFWRKLGKTCKSIAKVATVVACVGLAATGVGAPLAIAAAALSVAALTQSEYRWMQRLGVSDENARWAELGLTVGAAVCSGGAAAGAGGATTALSTAGHVATGAATATRGAATATAGAASVEEARHERVAEHHDARAVGHRLTADEHEGEIDEVIDRVETCESEHQRFLERLVEAHQTQDAARESAIWRV